MSLEALRQLRRSGRRPECVFVFVGRPRYDYESPAVVVIDRDGMDLRPLLGVGVYLIDVQSDPDFTLRVVAELQALQTTLRGGAVPFGAVGADESHETSMQLFRMAMCPQ